LKFPRFPGRGGCGVRDHAALGAMFAFA
jgi:hypothetical protein